MRLSASSCKKSIVSGRCSFSSFNWNSKLRSFNWINIESDNATGGTWNKTITICICIQNTPANTRRSPDVGTTLGQRRRRWPNVVPTLGKCFVFAGTVLKRSQFYSATCPSDNQSPSSTVANTWCWPNVVLLLGQCRRRWVSEHNVALCRHLYFISRDSSEWWWYTWDTYICIVRVNFHFSTVSTFGCGCIISPHCLHTIINWSQPRITRNSEKGLFPGFRWVTWNNIH